MCFGSLVALPKIPLKFRASLKYRTDSFSVTFLYSNSALDFRGICQLAANEPKQMAEKYDRNKIRYFGDFFK